MVLMVILAFVEVPLAAKSTTGPNAVLPTSPTLTPSTASAASPSSTFQPSNGGSRSSGNADVDVGPSSGES